MSNVEVATITEEGIKSVIKQASDQYRQGILSMADYQATLTTLCDTHGTDYIGHLTVEVLEGRA